ncbi:MAG: helix-turn-helix domain-containing protein [Glutamicibacter ardleyensis]
MNMTMTHSETATAPFSEIARQEIRAWMARRGYQQRDLAEAIGLKQSSASLRLNGKVPFTLDDIASIAAWMEISIADLIGSRALNEKRPDPRNADQGDNELLQLDLNQQPFD